MLHGLPVLRIRTSLPGVLAVWLSCVWALNAYGQSGKQLVQELNGQVQPANSNNQATPPVLPPSTLDHLHAVIVSALDGKPVQRVLVSGMGDNFAVLTDYEGRFSFDLRRPIAPQGATPSTSTTRLQFSLRKPGYMPRSVTASVPQYTPEGPEPELRFTITPANIILGHITAESGHLPQFLNIQVYRRQVNDGEAMFLPSGSAQVDPNGDFRFADLAPGDYKLTSPGSGRPPNLRRPNAEQPDSIPGLLPIFYPEADSLASAGAIHLGQGQTVTANLSLRAAPFYRVTIPVAAEDNMPVGIMLQGNAGFNLGYNQRDHAVEGFLPTGAYTARLMGQSGPRGRMNPMPPGTMSLSAGPPGSQLMAQLTASITFHVGRAPIQLAPVALSPGEDIQVNIHRDLTDTTQTTSTAAVPAQNTTPLTAVVTLMPLDRSSGFGGSASTSAPTPDGDLVLRGAQPGAYRVHAQAMGGKAYISSLTSGTTDLLTEPLVIPTDGGVPPIELTLRNDGAGLNVHVDDNTLPGGSSQQRAALITAIPIDHPNRDAVVGMQILNPPAGYVNLNAMLGQSFSNLAPGRYLVLAQEQSDQGNPFAGTIEYRNPKAIEPLLSKGQIVTLTQGEQTDIHLPLMSSDALAEQPSQQ